MHLVAMNENIREENEQSKGSQPLNEQTAEEQGVHPKVARHENVATPK